MTTTATKKASDDSNGRRRSESGQRSRVYGSGSSWGAPGFRLASRRRFTEAYRMTTMLGAQASPRLASPERLGDRQARKDPQEGYRTLVENQPVYIHPSSALFQRQPDWVIYHELVMTTKEYMREVTVVDPKWLVELAPRFYKSADPTKMSKRKRQERIEPLYDRYHEPNSWRLSKRRA
ncbi:hypothetical protein B296_00056438 [Ensete ventricosum]|uniref:DEAD-box helicase OB fold domain-containing protein n=1 Tax=Ensete ventricosum TaxID=4639 RepID=A0A426XB01_ENSVE|nr:hypothetical protein B296_00056438 [Ensete ventricosum]